MPHVKDTLGDLLTRRRPAPSVVLLVTSLAVGLLTGVGSIVFRYLITVVSRVGYEWYPRVTAAWGVSYVVVVPAVGGLVVGILVYLFAREAKGHGVPEVMEAVALRGGRIRPTVAVVKALASAVCIGSGGSAGREGPIVQIGSSLGSSVGQALRLSDDRVRNLVGCGAAAGIAATFNAPIAGVMFALEVILGDFGVRQLSTVVIAAVAASVVGRAAFGNVLAFPIRAEYGVGNPTEYALYALMAVLAALAAVAFVRMLYGTEDLFDRWRGVPEWFKPAVGGALLGLLALAYPMVTGVTWQRVPHVYNVGYEVIAGALENQHTLALVAVLLVAKMLATSLTLGSGGSGGVFAPSLFMGAMLGSTFALVVERVAPGVVSSPGAYALVGMAAVFAAAAHAPITAFLIVFELTADYGLILPLMLAVTIATLVGQRLLHGESIYTLKLTRRGVRLRSGRDVDILSSVTVAEAMSTDFQTVSVNMPISELSRTIARHRKLGFPVVDEAGALWGIVTVEDLDRALADETPEAAPVRDIATSYPRLQVAYPDEPMGTALARMGERGIGRLPVVDRERDRHLVGLIRRNDIVRAYNIALSRRGEIGQQIRRMQDKEEGGQGAAFTRIRLLHSHAAVGRHVRDLASHPGPDWILVSVQRGGRVLIPHGDTILAADDELTVLAAPDDAGQVLAMLQDRSGDRTVAR